ncbi:hypothetical protein MAALD49_15490 [Marinobacter shengliensis]|nr:hypothetical protein MAALD49_15490 [Marinobacter shengliensis]
MAADDGLLACATWDTFYWVINAGLNEHRFTVIFRRALPFVYGLTNSGQKPERQQYTDTD